MATIRKRQARWQGQVRRQGYSPVSKTFRHKKDAERWAREVEAAMERDDWLSPESQLKTLTLGDLIKRYLKTVSIRKRGHEIERWVLGALQRHPLSETHLCDLTAGVMARYRDERLGEVAPSTVHRQLTLIQHVLEVASREWDIPLPGNPVRQVAKPIFNNARTRRLGEAEYRSLEKASGKTRNPFIWPMVRFAIETAMRRGEILKAEWAHVDQGKRTLFIPETKNGHPRTIPLTGTALDILNALPTDDARLFPLSIEAFKQAWERLVVRAGIEDLHFHDLRHEATSRFFEMGLSLPEVALITGHRDFRMLQRYTHLRAEDVGRKLA